MKKALIAFLLLLLSILTPKQAFAQDKFSTSYNINYTINNNSNTHVSMDIVIKNLTERFYAPTYSMDVGYSDIANLIAKDIDGAITPKIEKTSKGSHITVDFNADITGLNQENKFNISFDTKEVANNYNNVWDVNIPGIANQNDFSSFNVTVFYPKFLDKPTFIKPAVVDVNSLTSDNVLHFTKEQLGSSGISIAFGKFQVYDFNLSYNLENKNVFTVSTEIALPPNTNYQEVAIDSLTPKPANVKIDKDGNWLAQYTLSPGKIVKVNALGKVKVYLNPKGETLSKDLMQSYLKPQKYWESKNAKIISIVHDLKTPKDIYDFVVANLKYDYERVNNKSQRLGALSVLANPASAVCLEFTDLFVALARAAGIPAREIDGFAYTNNAKDRPLSLVEDILHAWPEYYDFERKSWVMIDPTWGNTTNGTDYFHTLDFNHITFTIKGDDSTYPVPAGGYKLTNNTDSKDVSVTLGVNYEYSHDKLTSEILIPDKLIAGFPVNGYIKITNNGNTLINSKDAKLESKFLTPKLQVSQIDQIPPFGFIEIPLSFQKTPFLTNKADTVKITVENNSTSKNVKILPIFATDIFMIGGLVFVSICISISIIAYLFRRISISRQKRASYLRWEGQKPTQ